MTEKPEVCACGHANAAHGADGEGYIRCWFGDCNCGWRIHRDAKLSYLAKELRTIAVQVGDVGGWRIAGLKIMCAADRIEQLEEASAREGRHARRVTIEQLTLRVGELEAALLTIGYGGTMPVESYGAIAREALADRTADEPSCTCAMNLGPNAYKNPDCPVHAMETSERQP